MSFRRKKAASRPVGKLGRLPGSIPVGLRDLTYYSAGPLPAAPSSVAVPDFQNWGMLGNDHYGDCGVAGLTHGLEADATITGRTESWPSEQDVIQYYLDYTDGQDAGVVLSQFLAHVRSKGFLGHSVAAYAPVAVHDIPTLHSAVALYGFAYTGIAVTALMQQAFAQHKPWDMSVLDSQVVGGHCVPLVGYDDHCVYAVTWGGVQPITYSAWHYISQEAWAIISGEFVAANGDGRGVSISALRADLDKLA